MKTLKCKDCKNPLEDCCCYEEKENAFVDSAESLMDNYDITFEELVSILKDRMDYEGEKKIFINGEEIH